MNDVFVFIREYWFEIINYNMHYIHMCYKCLACESKMASILNLIVGSSVGCPLNCPQVSYLKIVGCKLNCPLSCLLYPYMKVAGSLICMTKFPWASYGQPAPLPTQLPTVSIYGSSGQSYLHGKIPMDSTLRCPVTCLLFSNLEAVGCLLSCPLFPYMKVMGSLFLHGKIPMGSPRAAHSVTHVQPMGSSPVFAIWVSFNNTNMPFTNE